MRLSGVIAWYRVFQGAQLPKASEREEQRGSLSQTHSMRRVLNPQNKPKVCLVSLVHPPAKLKEVNKLNVKLLLANAEETGTFLSVSLSVSMPIEIGGLTLTKSQ